MVKIRSTTNPIVHPFQKAREYNRAVIATKIEKIFAQPFLANLSGHADGVAVFAKTSEYLSRFASGDFSGEIRYWDLSHKKTMFSLRAHDKFIKGISFDRFGHNIFSCGDDDIVSIFNIRKCMEDQAASKVIQASNKVNSETILQCIDSSHADPYFVTGGEIVQLWSEERAAPFQKCDWGIDTVTKVKFNPVETNLIACTSMDRGVYIYDIRGKAGLKKTIMMNKCSCVAWNPQEPFNFTVGCEDGNAYSYDMRKLEEVRMIYKDHIGAILDIDYSPTGSHFVTGSYDKTLRIFNTRGGSSTQLFHTKRMQK